MPKSKDQWHHRKSLTFRQAEGLDPIPTQLSPSSISREMRVGLWDLFGKMISDSAVLRKDLFNFSLDHSSHDLNNRWKTILFDYHSKITAGFAEDFSWRWEEDVRPKFRRLFEEGMYADILEFVQFTLRHPECPKSLANEIARLLKQTKSAYRLVKNPPTLVPLALPQAVAAVEKAFNDTRRSSFGAAHQHLVDASKHLTAGDESGAVRESIHAVESVAKLISGDSKATLSVALKRIEAGTDALHPALRAAFATLYGYTSDKHGIRHASLEPGDKKVGEDEAIFMFVACAAFVSYLISKASKLPDESANEP